MKRAALACLLALGAASASGQSPAPSWPSAAEPAGDPRAILGRPAGAGLSGAALDAATEDVAGLLRCPVCQGLSVADSPSTMAQNMKRQVRDLLASGYDEQQVMAYFERSYGEFVRLKPPLRGINWLLWLAPAAALAAGGFVFARLTRRGGAGVAPRPAAAAPAPPADPALAAYRDRVRALAFGEAAPPPGTPGDPGRERR